MDPPYYDTLYYVTLYYFALYYFRLAEYYRKRVQQSKLPSVAVATFHTCSELNVLYCAELHCTVLN